MPRVTAFVAAAAVLAAACSSESPVAPLAAGAPQLAKGSSGGGGSTPAPSVAAVAGTWSGTYQRSATVPGDSTRWSLFLTQNGSKLEGGLTFVTYVNGQLLSATSSSIKKGSVSGNGIALELPRGEGAETPTTLSGTVGDDGRSMVVFHSRYPNPVTLTRR